MDLTPKYQFLPFQRCEHSCDGASDHGVRTEDRLCQEHYRGHPVLPLQQAEQDEEAGLHRVQAAGVHAGEGRCVCTRAGAPALSSGLFVHEISPSLRELIWGLCFL